MHMRNCKRISAKLWYLCALADGDVSQHRRTSANQNIVLDLWVPVASILAGACRLEAGSISNLLCEGARVWQRHTYADTQACSTEDWSSVS
jgi:hypothetical protein